MHLQCHICGSTYGLNPLPSDQATAEKWKEAIPDATPDVFTRNFRLCVLHFDPIYVFHRRYLLKWAFPERLYFNGNNWQKEKCDLPAPAKSKTPARSAPASVAPPVRYAPGSINADESPVVLPLPPRRDDEPDTDPLALPDASALKTPVISHVTSLRQPDVIPSPVPRSNGPQSSHRGSRVSAGSPGLRPSKTPTKNAHPMKTKTSPNKPKITVKSPAQLSAPQTNTGFKGVLQIPKDQIALPASQKSSLKALKSQIVSPKLAEPSRSLAHEQTKRRAVFASDQRQPTGTTDSLQNSAIVQNQSKLFVIENPRTLHSKSKHASPTAKDSQTKKQGMANTKAAHKTPLQIDCHGTSRHKLSGVQKDATPNSPANTMQASTTKPIERYTERHARQAIAAAKADIKKSNQKAEILRKKVDLVKLKVSTYETLIANLVRKNIISADSAKQCRVLEKDVKRHTKKRKLAPDCDEIDYGDGINNNSRDNSNDSLDSLNARDHDYL